jgi:hypothetical protein
VSFIGVFVPGSCPLRGIAVPQRGLGTQGLILLSWRRPPSTPGWDPAARPRTRFLARPRAPPPEARAASHAPGSRWAQRSSGVGRCRWALLNDLSGGWSPWTWSFWHVGSHWASAGLEVLPCLCFRHPQNQGGSLRLHPRTAGFSPWNAAGPPHKVRHQIFVSKQNSSLTQQNLGILWQCRC